MPTLDDVFQGKYLKTTDLQGREVRVTIQSCEIQKLDDGNKLAIHFQGKEKSLLANKTNCNIIAEMYGRDYSYWAGKEITLYPARVEYAGKIVDGIRVRLPNSGAGNTGSSQSQGAPTISAAKADWDTQKMAGPPSGHPASEAPFNDDVPF